MIDWQTEPDVMEFEKLDISDTKHVDSRPFRYRKSIVFVTFADAQITLVDVEKMMETGMNVARFKTSHSTKGDKVKLLKKFDKGATFLAHKYGILDWPCATCIELKTCVVQTGILEEDVTEITIKENTELILTYDISVYNKCNEKRIFVDNPYLASDVTIGMVINIAQDEIILECLEIVNDKSVKCLVTKGGQLQNMSYVCMRGAIRTRPYVTKTDLHIIKFAVEYQVDMLIINYVRHIETVKRIKQYLGSKLKRPIIVTGICTEEGLNNIDEVIKEADAVLLSREFLAYELKLSLCGRMGAIQKNVAAKCRKAGKPFYLAGEIFTEALLTGNFCVREMSDVTNAILEGASGFVLRETPNVDYLIEVMKTMNELCSTVEPLSNDRPDFYHMLSQVKMPLNAAEASAMSAVLVANQTNARVVIVPTVTGRSVYLMNWLKPINIIIAVTTKIRTVRLLNTYRSVKAFLYKGAPRRTWFATVQARVNFAIELAVEKNWIMYGDHYVTLEKGTEASSFCDTVRVWNVTVTKKNTIKCPESYHDFTVNDLTLQEPPSRKKRKSIPAAVEVIKEAEAKDLAAEQSEELHKDRSKEKIQEKADENNENKVKESV